MASPPHAPRCTGAPPRPVCAALRAAPTAPRARARTAARGRAAERHPTPTRPPQPRGDLDLPTGHRPRRNHPDRPRPATADDPCQRRARPPAPSLIADRPQSELGEPFSLVHRSAFSIVVEIWTFRSKAGRARRAPCCASRTTSASSGDGARARRAPPGRAVGNAVAGGRCIEHHRTLMVFRTVGKVVRPSACAGARCGGRGVRVLTGTGGRARCARSTPLFGLDARPRGGVRRARPAGMPPH